MGSYDAGSADWDAICGNYLITWAWDYDQADPNVGVNDKADTLLGNLIDGVDAGTDYGTDVSTKINFNLTITATQID